MPPISNATSNQPTTFVSDLAWSFIGLTALSVLLSAVQYALFTHVLPMEPLRAAFTDAINSKLLPPSTLKVLEYLPSVLIVLFIVSLLTLLVSIALLKRRDWARITFAWIMIAAAILHIAGLVLPFYFMHDYSAALHNMPPELRGVASTVMTCITAMSMVMGIVFAGVFAWIAKRLFSADISQEFLTH